jgi:hypothetical protein
VTNKQEKMREFDLFPVEEFVRWLCFLAHRGEWGSLKEVQSHLLGKREPCGLVWGGLSTMGWWQVANKQVR